MHRYIYTSMQEGYYNSWGEAMLKQRPCEFNELNQRAKKLLENRN